MKVCKRCGVEKPLSEFYKYTSSKNRPAVFGKCKTCTRSDVRSNREAKRDYYLAYDRGRAAEKTEGVTASKRRHPEHHLARIAVHNAVKRGKMQKQPCEVCGETKVEAHHEDYTKRLDVRWLCRKHHGEAHRLDKAS